MQGGEGSYDRRSLTTAGLIEEVRVRLPRDAHSKRAAMIHLHLAKPRPEATRTSMRPAVVKLLLS